MQHLINRTIDYVRGVLFGAESAHDWWHIRRVRCLAMYIAEREGGDGLIVQLAALLHDLSDAKFNGGDETLGARRARAWLDAQGAAPEVAAHVEQIILHLSFKGGNAGGGFRSKELDIVQDADRLDALGAVGIARAFAYGGFKGQALYDPNETPRVGMSPEEYRRHSPSTVGHFYEKLLLLRDRMNTPTGKALAERRHAFMERFLDEFYREWDEGLGLDETKTAK